MAKKAFSDLISTFIESEIREKNVKSIVKYLDNGKTTFLEFVECMKQPLTNPVNETRLKATQLLSHTIKLLRKDYLNFDEIDVLVGFLVSKFSDHHLVAPKSIEGLYALVRCTHCSDETLKHIMTSIFRGLTVQTLLRQDRSTIYLLFKYILNHHLALVQGMGGDFVAGFTQMVDSERDPRNLLIVFKMVSIVAASVPLGGMVEELFEVVACYFPVDYNPPSSQTNEEKLVSRKEMQEGLMGCMVATPAFAPFCLPLIFDKLDSGWSEGRIDALECFAAGCAVFDVKLIHDYSSAVWSNVKRDMFSNKTEYAEVNGRVLSAMCLAFDGHNKGNRQAVQGDYLKLFIDLVFEECGLYLEQPSTPIFQHSIKLLSLVASSSASAHHCILLTTIPQLIKEFNIHKQVVARLNVLKAILNLLVCRSATGGACGGVLSVEVLSKLKEVTMSTATNTDLQCFSLKTLVALVVEGFYDVDDGDFGGGGNRCESKCCDNSDKGSDGDGSEGCHNKVNMQCCRSNNEDISGEVCGADEGIHNYQYGGGIAIKKYKVKKDEVDILKHLLDFTFNTCNLQVRKVCAELLFMLSEKRRTLVSNFLFQLFTHKLQLELEKTLQKKIDGGSDSDDAIYYLISTLTCFSKALLAETSRFLFTWLPVFVHHQLPVDGVPYRLAPDFSCYDIMAQNLITCSVETFEKILELNNISEKIRGGKRTEEEQRYLTGEFLAASYDLLTPSTKYHFASQVSHHTHRMSGLFSCIASIVKCFPSKDTRWFTEKCAQVFLQDPPHNLPLLRATLCVCQDKGDRCEELMDRCYNVLECEEEQLRMACVCFGLLLDKSFNVLDVNDEGPIEVHKDTYKHTEMLIQKYRDIMIKNNNILLWCHVTKVLLKHQHHMCQEFCQQLLVWLDTDEPTSQRTSVAVVEVIVGAMSGGTHMKSGCCGGREEKDECCEGNKKPKEEHEEEEESEDASRIRFFLLMINPLVSQYNSSKPECRKYHLELFCYMSSQAPPSTIRNNIATMLPLAVQSLHYESNNQSKRAVWLSSLHLFRSFLSSCPRDVTPYLYDIIQRLLLLVVYPDDMAVRVESLKNLILIGRLKEATNLLTNRQAVLKVLDVSIADKKRAVRKFASLAKYTWVTLTEPSGDDED